MLEEKTQAPKFCLPDETGKTHCLDDYKGRYVLLYFYPKDDTPGCTKEACALRDTHQSYTDSSIVVLGVSADSTESHTRFKEKYELPFTLLSDPEKKVIEKYGARGPLGTKRISYLIDGDGIIQKAYEKVDPKDHATEVLADATLRMML